MSHSAYFVHVNMCVYILVHSCLYMCVFICTYTIIYIIVCVCTYIYIYIAINIDISQPVLVCYHEFCYRIAYIGTFRG